MTVILSIDPGRKNLGACLLRVGDKVDGSQDEILSWSLVAAPTDPAQFAAVLASLSRGKDFDEVVIEQQPPKNAVMLRLESWMEMYFAMKGVPLHTLHAACKLKYAATTPYWPPTTGEGWTYVKRKKLSVRTAEGFAATQTHAIQDLFHNSPKKDDLADSLLQGLAWAHMYKMQAEYPGKKKNGFPKGRLPPKAQLERSKRYTASNVVHFLQECNTVEEIEEMARHDELLKKAIKKYFEDPALFLKERAEHLLKQKEMRERQERQAEKEEIVD
jgi:hypothetical protein